MKAYFTITHVHTDDIRRVFSNEICHYQPVPPLNFDDAGDYTAKIILRADVPDDTTDDLLDETARFLQENYSYCLPVDQTIVIPPAKSLDFDHTDRDSATVRDIFNVVKRKWKINRRWTTGKLKDHSGEIAAPPPESEDEKAKKKKLLEIVLAQKIEIEKAIQEAKDRDPEIFDELTKIPPAEPVPNTINTDENQYIDIEQFLESHSQQL